jgi:hypothetical protein
MEKETLEVLEEGTEMNVDGPMACCLASLMWVF